MHPERIIEIIVKLLAFMQDNNQIASEDLEKLSRLGYSQSEINTAFQWLYKNFLPKEDFSDKSYKSASHRVFHEVEERVISPEGRGYLIQLAGLELITNIDLETIIERLMLTGLQHINLIDVKMLTSNFLIEKYGSAFYIGNFIESEDKIN